MFKLKDSEVSTSEKLETVEKASDQIKPETGITMEDYEAILEQLYGDILVEESQVDEKVFDEMPRIPNLPGMPDQPEGTTDKHKMPTPVDIPKLPIMSEIRDVAKQESADAKDTKVATIEKNREDGAKREEEVKDDLKEEYPEKEGYTIESETFLRDKEGNIVRDPETGEARRIDYVVVKDGVAVDSIEVTSQTADKKRQSEKEERIRENGGNYIIDSEGNLVEIPEDVKTRIDRRD